MIHRTLIAASFLSLSACGTMDGFIPTSGPRTRDVPEAATPHGSIDANHPGPAVQLVDVTEDLARSLAERRHRELFSETLGNAPAAPPTVGVGDALDIAIWEAPPAALFGSTALDTRSGANLSTAHGTPLGDFVVGTDGSISVPFAGVLKVAGRSLRQIEADIAQRLKGKANQPQVQVRMARNASANVTVVGEVVSNLRMPLTPKGERLLDALASAGGVKHPVSKVMLQVTRGQAVHTLPLDTVIRDPQQNIPLQPGDVITALNQPLSFTALGAVTKNDEIAFEGQGITLAQALARVGGLQDQRADARGVFIFRLESPGAVPVIYRIDLHDARSLFVAQTFYVQDKDLMYVSNAPAADLQKFVNVIAGIGYPIASLISVSK